MGDLCALLKAVTSFSSLNFHIIQMSSLPIFGGLTSVEGEALGPSRHKELPSVTRLLPRQRGQSAGHQMQGCNWEMGVWCGSGVGDDIKGAVFTLPEKTDYVSAGVCYSGIKTVKTTLTPNRSNIRVEVRLFFINSLLCVCV